MSQRTSTTSRSAKRAALPPQPDIRLVDFQRMMGKLLGTPVGAPSWGMLALNVEAEKKALREAGVPELAIARSAAELVAARSVPPNGARTVTRDLDAFEKQAEDEAI